MKPVSNFTTCNPQDTSLKNELLSIPANSANTVHSSLAGILHAFRQLRTTEHEFVLATIVETQGSTYRKSGARMLITRSGQYCGLLGGGCFESDLIEHASQVFETRLPRELFYDMRSPEDLIWGLGLGCNGAVRIWLEYLSSDYGYSPMSLLETGLASESASVLITCMPSNSKSQAVHYLYGQYGKIPVEHCPPEAYIGHAEHTLDTGLSVLMEMTVDTQVQRVFFNRISPPVQLLVIGGGPDAVPVTILASQLGWQVTLVDYRENYTKAENFPAAQNVICVTPEQLTDKVPLDKFSAVVLMTHKYDYDLRYLRQLIHTEVKYIGLLGPTVRRDELLRAVGSLATAKITGRIFGPVGLDIGGELPEEIALSLLSEIQSVLYQRNGEHLSFKANATTTASKSGNLAVVVLAAGGSTRFGGLKQLLEYQGKSLLKRVVDTGSRLGARQVIVVHGPKPTKCQRDITGYDVQNIVNDNWDTGMASSLKLAMKSVRDDIDAVLILLCDQPLINSMQLEILIQKWRNQPGKIIASEYANSLGVPAIFPRTFFQDFKQLTGDSGAKKLLTSNANHTVPVPMPEAEIDIDTNQDFADLLLRSSDQE